MKITSLIRSRRQKKIKVGKRNIIMKKERKKKAVQQQIVSYIMYRNIAG
jgi:hypothetical protein